MSVPVPIETSWAQSLVSVFLMDTPAIIAAIAFFLLLLAFEGRRQQ